MFPVPVLKLVPGNVNTVPAIAVIPVFAPSVGTASVSAFVSWIATLAPVAFSVTAPVKSFVPCDSAIVPVPALTVVVPPTVNVPPV
jgi:hypothetical protein